jgi:hypothetical protein
MEMLTTHRVNTLLAWNIDDILLAAQAYQMALAGAHARVTFTMKHWFIKGTHIFVGNIESI